MNKYLFCIQLFYQIYFNVGSLSQNKMVHQILSLQMIVSKIMFACLYEFMTYVTIYWNKHCNYWTQIFFGSQIENQIKICKYLVTKQCTIKKIYNAFYSCTLWVILYENQSKANTVAGRISNYL